MMKPPKIPISMISGMGKALEPFVLGKVLRGETITLGVPPIKFHPLALVLEWPPIGSAKDELQEKEQSTP
jgi:hypothetical protein